MSEPPTRSTTGVRTAQSKAGSFRVWRRFAIGRVRQLRGKTTVLSLVGRGEHIHRHSSGEHASIADNGLNREIGGKAPEDSEREK